MQEDVNIAQLRKLTEALPPIPNWKAIFVDESSRGPLHEILTQEGGNLTEIIVHTEPGVAIGRRWAKAGTVVAEHSHPGEVEVFIVFEGELNIAQTGLPTHRVGEGEVSWVQRGIPHTVTFLEDSSFIAVTVPAAEGMR